MTGVSTLALAVILRIFTAGQDEEDDPVGPPDVVEDCALRLQEAGVTTRDASLPLRRRGSNTFECGAEQVVRYVRGPGQIRYNHSPKLTCQLGLGLAAFEIIVQEEARRHFGKRVARIEHVGTYNCREMAAYPGWVSEHSYANAIDLRAFILTDGTEIAVGRHFGRSQTKKPSSKRKFLRAIASRAYAEDVFQVVLTPNFDRAHAGHFHFDMARYRVDGT